MGGGGNGVRRGSGDDALDREKRLEMVGKSAFVGSESDVRDSDDGGVGGGGGSAQKVITDADSAKSVSPIL